MLVSCAVALFIPFELFLFAYAVLGPAHYLTEISWLEQRKFFTPGRYDFLAFAALAVAVFFGPPPVNEHYTVTQAVCTATALGTALVFVLTRETGPRLAGVAAAIAIALLLSQVSYTALFLAMFVPTVVHVYLFTGFFMIYGALKERNLNGYLAFAVFLACPLLCWFLDPAHYEPRPYVAVSYWKNFSLLNLSLLGIPVPHTRDEGVAAGSAVFVSTMGWRVMRFIAFAYTYHYLNWFSKTSVIRWHEVGRKRLAAVALSGSRQWVPMHTTIRSASACCSA